MHDTVKVIGLAQGLHFLNLHLQEVILLPCKEREKSGGGVEGVACVLPVPVRGCLSEGVEDAEGKGDRLYRSPFQEKRLENLPKGEGQETTDRKQEEQN